jgi:type IV secretory pathway TraG/TraD family ATPase VirD4
VYFTGLSDESRAISDTLGVYEYQDDNGYKRIRTLMTPDEVRTMSKDQILVVPSGMQPLKCKTIPFYKQSKLVKYMELEPLSGIRQQNPEYTAQYIDFEKYRDDKNQRPQDNEVQ